MTDNAGPDWPTIRHRYEETQDAVADICRDAGITERALGHARKKGAWRRKHPRPFPPPRAPRPDRAIAFAVEQAVPDAMADASSRSRTKAERRAVPPSGLPRRVLATPAARRRLLERLVAAISMKLEQLERRMSIDLANDEETTATDHERETRAIGALIDNLEKIRELETALAPAPGKSGPAVTTDLADEADRCRRELADRLSRLVEAAGKGS